MIFRIFTRKFFSNDVYGISGRGSAAGKWGFGNKAQGNWFTGKIVPHVKSILFRANTALICKCFDKFRIIVCEPPWSRWKCSWIRENSHCTTYLRFLDAPRSLNSPKTDLGVSWSLYAS